ncbi:MAG TPA: glycoside hydrolase family 31 protein [Vicinamibacterales bacterium]|nr:glycoside hydrolase family 31 protein [Vicinamibacterales bacterium]
MPRTRLPNVTLLVVLWILVAPPTPARAQWNSIGDVSAPRRDGQSVTFTSRQGTIQVSAIAPEIVRVRMAPSAKLGRDHSYAVVSRDFGEPGASIAVRGDATTLTTRALRVTLRHRPFRVSIADASGNSLYEDDPAMGIAVSRQGSRVYARLRPDENVYGLGEKSGKLNRRGKMLGGYSFTMWNSDTFGYDASIDPLYASFPFLLVLRNGRAHGIFLDNTHRSNFDIGHQFHGVLSFGADGGELDYYFIDGPDPKQVIARYTQLTGRMPLPPRWALGFHQCRYSYYPESRVRFIADNFRERRIPADVLWLDIHYLDGYNPFTWDRQRFPDPARLIADLREKGFRTVTIIDPHPKKQAGWDVYDSGLAGDHFVKNPDGSVLEAPVWPSNAEKDPGPSVFPDFSRSATREWWGGLYKRLVDIGVAGIWNDMNEPALFVPPTGTMPLDARHDGEGEPTDHREIHNVYGMLMTRATFEGLLRLRPDARPFVLTRATFAGGQRYAAAWPGDNVSTWTALQGTIPMLASMGLSGMPFVGSDIGGFADVPTAELFTRWLQTGVFYPFMRAHTTFGTDDQEPWSYGVAHEIVNRRAIGLRYELLPHIYNVMQQASETGLPALRPAFLEFPSDPRTWDQDDQFMFGADLLVAPVLRPGERVRGVYLPKGAAWYDFWTGRRYEGDRFVPVPVTLASLPIFAREGAFIFQQPAIQHTGEMRSQPLHVAVYPAPSSSAALYEDDGESLQYRRGAFLKRRFTQARATDADGRDAKVTIDVGAPEGSWRPAARPLVLSVRWTGDVRAVSATAAGPLPRLAPEALEQQPTGWTVTDEGFVRVKLPDRFEAVSVTIER